MTVETFPDQLYLDVFTLAFDDQNYNKHPKAQIDALVAGIREFGQRKPIVIRSVDGVPTVVAGEGTTLAMRRLAQENLSKWGKIWVTVAPEEWDEVKAHGYMVSDNETARSAVVDTTSLLEITKNSRYDYTTLGFTQASYQALLDTVKEKDKPEDTFQPGAPLFSQDVIKQKAFEHFRAAGFPYRNLPLFYCMQEINKLAMLPQESLLHSTLCTQVADTYHPHRYLSSAAGKRSPYDSFHDDAQLKRVFQLYQEHAETQTIPLDIHSMLSLVKGTQACANFRPAFALSLYRQYCKAGATVLDTSTGYGGRLLGFLASGLAGKYIGIDPYTLTHQANVKMAQDLNFSEHIELYNQPSEDVDPSLLANRCDFAFTSPPYFSKEHYSDEETQSWKRYTTGELWRMQFLQRMLALQYIALKPGSAMLLNIQDVTIGTKSYPLVEWAIEDGKAAGFDYLKTTQYELHHRFGANQQEEVAVESVLVFQKPGG